MRLWKLEFRIQFTFSLHELTVYVNLQLSVDAHTEHNLAHILYIHLKILLIDYSSHLPFWNSISPNLSTFSWNKNNQYWKLLTVAY